ncbi:APC family permease [Actinomycetospora sp. TBRC 11914]|uniref:APC family permease n=1 Tax=Actinomycetospora sp. TBRC 11914 TaxID=2729387 RepID=UPI00289FA7A6|nr:APC family permease [Actinomycetospora sp. TBRC 11914]
MRGVPVLRARSPVAGLRRRTLGPFGVLAQSVATTAPAGAVAATPLLVAADAGRDAPWSFAVAAVLVGLVCACIAVFARRMAAAGGLYSFTAKGLGPGGAFACAVSVVVGYALLVAAALVGASWYARALVERLWPSAAGETTPIGIAVIVVLAVAIAWCAVRGVRLTGRVMLVIEGFSITLILTVLVVLALATAHGPGPGPPLPPSGGVGGVAAGVLPAVAAFIGFDSATALGVEARRPFATVPRAVATTAGGAALLYLAAALVNLAAPGVLPALTVAGTLGGTGAVTGIWAPLLLDAGIIASFSACTLAALNTLVRVLFSLAREGVAPALLGRTHRRHQTPAVAVAAAVPVLAAAPVVGTLVGVPPQTLLGGLLAVAAVGFLAAYLLVCLAAPRFLARIGELTRGIVVVAAVAVPALAAVVVVALVVDGGAVLAVVVGALLLAGLAGWLALRRARPSALAGMGVYDETTTADVHTGAAR